MRSPKFQAGQAVTCTDPNWRPIGQEDAGAIPISRIYHVASVFKKERRWYITLEELNARFGYSGTHFIQVKKAHTEKTKANTMSLAIIPQPTGTPSRMSTREVAELTGKNHADVMRDARTQSASLQKANMLSVCESASYVGANGQLYEMYNMDKETTICLLTGYDAVARMKVIQRWQALESSTPLALPQTRIQALRELAESLEREESLTQQLAEAQPAKDFYAAVTDSRDAIPVADAAKVLGIAGIGQNKLFTWMREKRILMSDQKHWNMPYQEYIERGYFRVVEQKYVDGRGETHINLKTMVLQKGLQYISKALTVSL